MRLESLHFGRPVALSIIAVVVLACVEGGRTDPAEPKAEPAAARTLAAVALSAAPAMWWSANDDDATLASTSVTIELAVDAGVPKDAAPPKDARPPVDAAPPIDAPPPIDAAPPIDAGPPPDALLTRDAAPRR
jgi:hypothetical protein